MTELDALIAQIQGLSDDQWSALHATLLVEAERRRAAPHVEQGQAEVVEGLVDAGVVTGPDATTPESWAETGTGAPAWVDPGTIHTRMYLVGAVVSHQGRTWESTHPGLNHWEPGSEGVDARIWRDITDLYQPEPEEPEEPEGAAPYRLDHAYSAGDQFAYQGVTYQVLQAHTSAAHWPPNQAPSLYQPI